MAEDSPLVKAIALIRQMDDILPAEQFLAWLEARPGSAFIYQQFVMPYSEEPEELVITSSTTLIEAYPGLVEWVSDYRARTVPLYRPNGDARHGTV